MNEPGERSHLSHLQSYLAGGEREVWERLRDLGGAVREEPHFAEARAVAREAMSRVRRNLEILIPRWVEAGHVFGYGWAARRHAEYVCQAPPLLASPTGEEVAAIERLESSRGPLPIALRAFYEIVGAVNFVGTVADGWPDRETLDPLQVELLSPQIPGLLQGDSDDVVICPDHLHNYFISGVGALMAPIPDRSFDGVLTFEGAPLRFGQKPLTFGGYLREVILGRGGIGLVAGFDDDAPNPALVEFLTRDLVAF